MKLKLILLAVLSRSPALQRPRTAATGATDEREQSVINEDGGRSFIIKPASALLHGVVKPGNRTVVDLQQHSIFWEAIGLNRHRAHARRS